MIWARVKNVRNVLVLVRIRQGMGTSTGVDPDLVARSPLGWRDYPNVEVTTGLIVAHWSASSGLVREASHLVDVRHFSAGKHVVSLGSKRRGSIVVSIFGRRKHKCFSEVLL